MLIPTAYVTIWTNAWNALTASTWITTNASKYQTNAFLMISIVEYVPNAFLDTLFSKMGYAHLTMLSHITTKTNASSALVTIALWIRNAFMPLQLILLHFRFFKQKIHYV